MLKAVDATPARAQTLLVVLKKYPPKHELAVAVFAALQSSMHASNEPTLGD